MNALGIAVDVSHCGPRTTAEAIEVSAKPILISHTGCRAVFDNPRNKDDAALRALAERGGVAGIYLMPYLSAGPGAITVDDLLRHVDHAVGVCGEDHVGIGSDQGIVPIEDNAEYRRQLREEIEARKKAGVSAPGESVDRPPFIPELNAPNRMETIATALSARGYKAAAIEGFTAPTSTASWARSGGRREPRSADRSPRGALGQSWPKGARDMHVHLGGVDGLLDIANGVTTVRDMANDMDTLLAMKKSFDDGTRSGRAWSWPVSSTAAGPSRADQGQVAPRRRRRPRWRPTPARVRPAQDLRLDRALVPLLARLAHGTACASRGTSLRS